MNCQHARNFVSSLYDGEAVPAEAAEHIRGCRACRELLRDYAEMGAELRLLANATSQEAPPALRLPPDRKRWSRGLTDHVLVPRFAAALAILAIVGLAAGLVVIRGQTEAPPLWFQYNVTIPKAERAANGPTGMGGLLHGSGDTGYVFLPAGDGKKIAAEIKTLRVQTDLVRLSVRARVVKPVPGSEEEKILNYEGVIGPHRVDPIFAGTAAREIDYSPEQKITIPVEGDGSLILTGKVYKIRPTIWGPAMPKPNQIQLYSGALVRGNDFLGKIQGGGSVEAKNSAFGICVPKVGALVIALQPFEGAIRGVAEYGQARFTIGGHDYTLYSATPITGGPQPREIWIYHSPACERGLPADIPTPLAFAFCDVSQALNALRKQDNARGNRVTPH